MPWGDLGLWKIIIIAVLLLVLFGGATRLPIFAKGLGQSVKVFRKEMHEVKTDIQSDRKAERTEDSAPVTIPADPSAETTARGAGSPGR